MYSRWLSGLGKSPEFCFPIAFRGGICASESLQGFVLRAGGNETKQEGEQIAIAMRRIGAPDFLIATAALAVHGGGKLTAKKSRHQACRFLRNVST